MINESIGREAARAVRGRAETSTLTYYAFPDIHCQKIRTTDEIDKHFLSGRAIIVPARATSRRSAAHRLKASPGGLI